MQEALWQGCPACADTERRIALLPIVEEFEQSLMSEPAVRRYKQEKITPKLRAIYLWEDRLTLRDDLKALDRPDNSEALGKRIEGLRAKLKSQQTKIDSHRGTAAACLRTPHLPSSWTTRLAQEGLDAGMQPSKVAEAIIRNFGKDWRERAPLFDEPVSVHGTSIRSMSGERKGVWTAAYEKMKLGELPAKPKIYSAFQKQRQKPVDLGHNFYLPRMDKVSQR